MGRKKSTPFNSDLVIDMLVELENVDDLGREIARILMEFLNEADSADADAIEEALAAACLVAAKVWGDAPHREARVWLAENDFAASAELISLANSVFDLATQPKDNALHNRQVKAEALRSWLDELAPYRLFLTGERSAAATSLSGAGESSAEEAGRLLREAAAATPRPEEVLATAMRAGGPGTVAAASLIAARHSGVSYDFEESEWFAENMLQLTPELLDAARAVLAEAAPWNDLLRLSLEGLSGERVVPVMSGLTAPEKGEKQAKAFAKDLRAGGFLTGCVSAADRERILWCAARASQILGKPVEVTFRGKAANVFTPDAI